MCFEAFYGAAAEAKLRLNWKEGDVWDRPECYKSQRQAQPHRTVPFDGVELAVADDIWSGVVLFHVVDLDECHGIAEMLQPMKYMLRDGKELNWPAA